MALKKESLIWIFVIIAIVIIILAIWYFSKPKVQDPNKTNTPVPPGSPTTKWISESFPLNVGMYGTKIKALQTALSIPADGKFGQQTNAAIKAKGYSIPLSESDYNMIVPSNTNTNTNNGSSINASSCAGASGKDILGYAQFDNTIVVNKSFKQPHSFSKNTCMGIVTGDSGVYWELDGKYYVRQDSSYVQYAN